MICLLVVEFSIKKTSIFDSRLKTINYQFMGIFRSFESGEHKKIKSHFEHLISIAMADGKIDDSEKEYLLALAQQYSITEEKVQHMLDSPEHYVFTAPYNKEERLNQLKEIIRILLIDNKITQNEINLCKKYAVALNYNPSIVVKLTNLLESYMNKPFDIYDVLSVVDDLME